jgi:hypothetical protein
MQKIYPLWRQYLQRKEKNIYQFLGELYTQNFDVSNTDTSGK